jgi:cytochrome c-type biogenesis protein
MNQTVLDGSLLLALPLAVLAGFVSFASPCVLPLVPGYLGYVTGLTGVDLERQRRGRLVAGAALFVAGFSAVFVTAGWLAGAAGDALVEHRTTLTRVLGAVTIVLGLVFAGLVPRLAGSRPLDVRPVAGLAGAPLLGAVFGLGWSPCIGPTLAAIVSLSGDFGDPGRGALLAGAYCVGLGVPFLFAALAYRRAMTAFGVLRRHRVAITRSGGVMLVAIGGLLVTGWWAGIVSTLQGTVTDFVPVV